MARGRIKGRKARRSMRPRPSQVPQAPADSIAGAIAASHPPAALQAAPAVELSPEPVPTPVVEATPVVESEPPRSPERGSVPAPPTDASPAAVAAPAPEPAAPIAPAPEVPAPVPEAVPAPEAVSAPEAPAPEAPAPPLLGATDHLTEQFFSKAPSQPPAPDEDWDELKVPMTLSMSTGSRRSMLATFAILAASALLIGGYLVYHKLIMPTPVTLGPMQGPLPVPTIAPAPQDRAPRQDSIGPAPGVAPATPVAPIAAAPAAGTEPVAETEPVTASSPAAGVPATAMATAPVEIDPGTPADPPASQSPAATTGSKPMRAAPSVPLVHERDGYVDTLANAKRLTRRGKHRQALETYHDALALRPGALFPLRKIAFLHLNLGQNAQARHFADRVLQRDPSNSEAWIVLGAALSATGDAAGAQKAYRRCAELGTGSYVTECRRLAR